MPELPEVETVVRELAQVLPGRRIREVEVIHADLLHEPPEHFRRALLGTRIQGVNRRGKNILLRLSGPQILAVNLGMTGRLLFRPVSGASLTTEGGDTATHEALLFTLEPPGVLLYDDARRFGSLERHHPREWEAKSKRLGPEPLDPALTSADFHRRLLRSRSPVRSWLLDQTRIAGIGNIYASEALFRSGVHPTRPARSLSEGESAALLAALREVLTEALQAGGTTLRDYRTASGGVGGFRPSLRVYDREGEPCPRCNTPVERIVFGNRSAFFCPRCQRSE